MPASSHQRSVSQSTPAARTSPSNPSRSTSTASRPTSPDSSSSHARPVSTRRETPPRRSSPPPRTHPSPSSSLSQSLPVTPRSRRSARARCQQPLREVPTGSSETRGHWREMQERRRSVRRTRPPRLMPLRNKWLFHSNFASGLRLGFVCFFRLACEGKVTNISIKGLLGVLS